jgi:hypothetical protein
LNIVKALDTSSAQIPADEYLPVTMYHNLWSHARMLLPGKVPTTVQSVGETTCALVSDGSSSSLHVDAALGNSSVPPWQLPDNTQSYDNLSLMLVRPICCCSLLPCATNNVDMNAWPMQAIMLHCEVFYPAACSHAAHCRNSLCCTVQRLLYIHVASNFMVDFCEVVCGICVLLGLLGALQAVDANCLVTSAVIQTGKDLFGIAFMMACIMPLISVLLYICTVADERLTRPTHLARSTIISLILGTTRSFLQVCHAPRR